MAGENIALPEVEVKPDDAPPAFDPKKPSKPVVSMANETATGSSASSDEAPAFNPSQPYESVDTRAAQQDPDLAGRLSRKIKGTSELIRSELHGQETGKYDYSGAPLGAQMDVAGAANEDEVRKALSHYTESGAMGQDKRGRWWVDIDGKKTIVEPEELAELLQTGPTTMLSGAGTVMGGVAGGAVGGPVGAGVGAVVGGGIGGFIGRGIEDTIKALRGNYATAPGDEATRLGRAGVENAAFSAIAPATTGVKAATRAAYRNLIGAKRHQEAIDRATRIWEDSGGKVIPPVESFAPEATRMVRGEQNRNLISYGGISPKNPERIEYMTDRFRRILRDQGMPEAQIDAAVESVISGRSATSSSDVGKGIVDIAQRRVRDAEQAIAADVDAAKGALRQEEIALRQFAGKSQAGSLGQDLEQFFVKQRQAFSGHFSKAYERINRQAGDARVIDMSEAITAAERMMELVEPASLPPIVVKVGNLRKTAEAMNKQADVLRGAGKTDEADALDNQAFALLNRTIEEAHALRNKLREGIYKLAPPGQMTPGPSFHAMGVVEDAVDQAFKDVAASGEGLPSEAAKNLKEVDKAYGEGIKFYKNNTVRQIVRDARDGNFAAPELIARNIFNPNEVEAAKDIWKRLPAPLKEKVLSADLQSKLVKASEQDSVTGNWVVKGKDFLKEWQRTRRINEIGYAPAFNQQIERWATELAAADGHLELSALKNPSAVVQSLANAAQKEQALNAFIKNDPVGALASNDPHTVDKAVRAITKPKAEKTTEDALNTIGRGTPEWLKVTHWAMVNLFEGAFEKTPAGDVTFSGQKIIKGLNDYTKKQQEMLFPNGLADDVRTLGEDIFALFPKGGDMAMGLSSGTVTNASVLNVRQVYKQMRFFTIGKIADSRAYLALVADLKRDHPNWDAAKVGVGQVGRALFNEQMVEPEHKRPGSNPAPAQTPGPAAQQIPAKPVRRFDSQGNPLQ